jgi:hypothetical protein
VVDKLSFFLKEVSPVYGNVELKKGEGEEEYYFDLDLGESPKINFLEVYLTTVHWQGCEVIDLEEGGSGTEVAVMDQRHKRNLS